MSATSTFAPRNVGDKLATLTLGLASRAFARPFTFPAITNTSSGKRVGVCGVLAIPSPPPEGLLLPVCPPLPPALSLPESPAESSEHGSKDPLGWLTQVPTWGVAHGFSP